MLSVKSIMRHALPIEERLVECVEVKWVSRGARSRGQVVSAEDLDGLYGLRPGLLLRGVAGKDCDQFFTQGDHYVMNSAGKTVARYNLEFGPEASTVFRDPEGADGTGSRVGTP